MLEEQLAARKESEEESEIVKERISSTTIHIPDGEDDIEQLFRASSEEVNLVDLQLNAEAGDFNPTSRESVAFQSSQQQEEVASLSLQAFKVATPSPASVQTNN